MYFCHLQLHDPSTLTLFLEAFDLGVYFSHLLCEALQHKSVMCRQCDWDHEFHNSDLEA